ncbi:MAG: TolC family protein [Elusimicrobia bacterium]|nr:TolC family protein [Elusimicrobiota bacterium]
MNSFKDYSTMGVLCGILCWGWPASRCAAVSPERVLTLEEAVTLAINNNQELLSAKEDANIAQQRVKEAQALFFPKLDLYAGYSRFNIRNLFPLSPGLGPAILQPTFETENFYQARASLYQTLYSGGRSWNTYRLAKVAQEQANSQYEATKNAVSYRAKKAFFDVRLEQARSELYAHSLLASWDEKRIQLFGTSQGLTSLERLKEEEELELYRGDAAQAARELERSRLVFLRTLAIEQHTGVELRGEFFQELPSMDLQKCLAWAKQYRPELRQTQFQAQIDALGVSLSLAERFPTVAFGSSYEFSGQRYPLSSPNWAATVYINLPLSVSNIYFGWTRTRERRAQYRQTRVQRAALEDAIELEVRQAFADCQFWHQEKVRREEAVRRLSNWQEAVTKKWPMKAGQPLRGSGVSAADVAQGERRLLEARLRALQALHGQTLAVVSLEHAMGRSFQGE